MGKVKRYSAIELEKLLISHGFVHISQSGSHRKWRNSETRKQVIVPAHGGRVLPVGTVVAILNGAEIPESKWQH